MKDFYRDANENWWFRTIGKGNKKVVKKIGKAFGKLGIVGQIGLMFLMPHLGTMWGNIGSWAAKGSNIHKKL